MTSISNDTENLDLYEKVNFLFKNYLGFPNTDKTKPFFQEVGVNANNYLYGSELFLDDVPVSPNFNITDDAQTLNIGTERYINGTTSIQSDSTRVIRKFVKIKLQKIPETNRGYYCLDNNGNNILSDAIQFNKVTDSEGNRPYLYELFDSNLEQLFPGTSTGNWIFDVRNGVVNFPDEITGNYTVNSDNPPYLTFYKYIGRKGINKIRTDDILGFESNTNNIQLKITELQERATDISQNVIDLSQNVIDLSSNINTRLNNFISQTNTNFTNINNRATDISQNVIDLSQNVVDLSSNINTRVDNFISQTNTNFTNINNRATDISQNVIDLSSNINTRVDNFISQTNINFTNINNRASDISQNVIDLSQNVVDLSSNINTRLDNFISQTNTNFTNINNRATDISQNVVDLSQKVIDLSSNINTRVDTLNDNLRTYIDNVVSGLDIKESVKVASVNNIDLSTTVQQIDNINISDGDRILLKDQTTATENGIYELSGNNLIRTSDFDSSTTVTYGAFTFVEQGSENSDKGFVLTNVDSNSDNITIGTTELTFSQFSGAGQLTAGDGITKTGDTLQLNVDNTTLSIVNGTLQIHSNYTSKIDNSFNDVYTKAEVNNITSNIQLDDLSNIDITGLQDGQFLKYDSTSSKWIPSTTTDNEGNSDIVNNSNQTFFELLTQQPKKFKAISSNTTSSQITINWNYDDIIPSHSTSIFAKLMFPSALADRSLPHIDEIRFDLSGVNTYNNNNSGVWINDNNATIEILSTHDYNSGNKYKTKNFLKTALSNADNSDIENILSKTTPIDIRVYGVTNNNDINYPDVNNRALIFSNLQFSESTAPSQPIRQSAEIVNLNSFSVNYKVSQTEKWSIWF